MLLSILLDPVKYQAGEGALTAKQVATKLLEDAGVDVAKLRGEVEVWLNKQPRVTITGDSTMISSQKQLGRVLGEVLKGGREIQKELKVG